MNQTTRISHDIASEASSALGRCPTEKGTSRLAEAIAGVAPAPRPSLDGIPTGDLTVDDRARLAEAIAVYHRTGSTRAIELTVELLRSEAMHAMYMWKHARENARLDSLTARVTAIVSPRLAAIDQGTKHEQTRAEFLSNMELNAKGEVGDGH